MEHSHGELSIKLQFGLKRSASYRSAQYSMLKKLFKRKPDISHSDPEIRKAALEQTDEISQEELENLVRQDPVLEIRRLALQRKNSIDFYQQYWDDDHLGHFCREQISNLIDDSHPLARDSRILPLILEKLNDPQAIFDIVSGLESDSEIAKTVVAIPTRNLRLDVANKAHNEQTLHELEKASRNHDKGLNREIRERLTRLKELRSKREELLADVHRLVEHAQKLSPANQHYETHWNAVEQDWKTILESIKTINQELTTHNQEVIDLENVQEQFPSKSQQQTGSLELPNFETILKSLRECPENEHAIDQCEADWLDALKVEAPPREIAEQFYQLANSKRRLCKDHVARRKIFNQINRLLKPIKLPDIKNGNADWKPLWKSESDAKSRSQAIERMVARLAELNSGEDWTESIANLKAAQEELNKLLVLVSERRKHTFEHINNNIAAVEKFIEEGELRKARSAERNANSLIARLPKPAQNKFHSKLSTTMVRIRDLEKWQDFAEQPKREQLCEAMEALIEQPLEPRKQFDEIKNLRDSWNVLGPTRSRENRDWQERFDQGAEKAFKICEQWFKQIDHQRAANLASRIALCEELEAFAKQYDWENADWPLVHETIRNAQDEWKKYHPVDRANFKKSRARYDKILDDLYSRLREHWEANATKKQALIDEVTQALANEEHSVSELVLVAKDVQHRWKDIGSAGRKLEQPMWKQFREKCDEIFDFRTTQKEQHRSTINENIAKAEELLKELEEQVQSDTATLNHLEPSHVSKVSVELGKIDLPKNASQKMRDRLSETAMLMEKKREALEEKHHATQLRELINLDLEFSELEDRGESIGKEMFLRAGPNQLLFRSRNAETAKNQQVTLHELVLRAEVLAEVPSPTEDANQRMQVQVSRLQHGLTRGGESDDQNIHRIIHDWCSLAFGRQPLRKRFHNAVNEHFERIGAS